MKFLQDPKVSAAFTSLIAAAIAYFSPKIDAVTAQTVAALASGWLLGAIADLYATKPAVAPKKPEGD